MGKDINWSRDIEVERTASAYITVETVDESIHHVTSAPVDGDGVSETPSLVTSLANSIEALMTREQLAGNGRPVFGPGDKVTIEIVA